MELYRIYEDNPSPRIISKAVKILKNDGLIVYPTDTIYGLGCSLFSKKALKRLYKIKDMSVKDPLSFVAPDLSNVSQYAVVENDAYRILRKYLPGPFTFILPANREINKYMLSKRKEVGIRVPDNNVCRMLTGELGAPIVTTSVPLWQETILNNGEAIAEYFNREIDLVLDSGTMISEPSTIVDLVSDPFEIIRKGKGEIYL
jgi:tRNA threonylcarbamoyl adenosine modification protein (Sua5/YciO/YrdC/YwlC family)